MTVPAISFIIFILAALPALLFLFNLPLFRTPPEKTPGDGDRPKISVLIPARNEEENIVGAVESVLGNDGVDLEVVVLDDHSADGTAELVAKLAEKDPRLRLEKAPELPTGWNGKQHACAILSEIARNELLLFLDADLRLHRGALSRIIAFLKQSRASLVSGFPRQKTETFMEKILISLIHFILLGFLPLGRMRKTTKPAYAAGTGQLIIVEREAYRRSGGHAAIRRSRHDGIALSRAFRKAGLRTDIFDAGNVASCRMYRSGREVFSGLAKNAVEGMAAPGRIIPFSLILAGGQILPLPWLIFLLIAGAGGLPVFLSSAALLLSYLPRLIAVSHFRQPLIGALLHPLGVLVLLGIQWYALGRKILGVPARWKGREYRDRGE